MLHVRCGDDILDRLRALDSGAAIRWCDPVCDGPAPSVLRGAAWREVRAHHLAMAYGRWTGMDEAAARRLLAAEDRALLAGARHDEVVLWFEADLFDQLILLALLARFGTCLTRSTQLSLLCIGDHPDVERFVGLGQLSTDQLGKLLMKRQAISDAQIDLARRLWLAFGDSDPHALESALVARDMTSLPFLGEALRRHLAEFPDCRDGLGTTERRILETLAEGERTPSALFTATQTCEPRPWMGDLMLWRVIEALAAGQTALVDIAGPEEWWRDRDSLAATRISLTRHGERVLSGEADRVALVPVERWHGGVHLHPAGLDWRWDRVQERIVGPN